jgi:MFS family permease
MSQGFVSPSSLRLELEARRMHAASPPQGVADLAPAMVLSGFPHTFDLALGALGAVFVFPQVFFAGLAPSLALWAGLAVWSIAYAAGPVGHWIFGVIRTRYGGGVALTASGFLLGASTAAVAFLPGSAQAGGAAVILLGLCRVAQGVAMGGAGEGSPLRQLRRTPEGRLWLGLTRALTVLLGLAAAAALFAVLSGALSRADFLDWGWRYPFVLGVPINIVALFAQLRLFTTDLAEHPGDRAPVRVASASNDH